jgi:NADPH2:quinone reductase
MRAWTVPRLGEPDEVLTLADVPDPEPGEGQVLVRVAAAAANFADILYVRGEYQERPPLPFVPGLEAAGEVVAAGPGAPFAPGDQVLGAPTLPVGGFGELTLLDADRVFAWPAGMTAAQAAGFHVSYQTGWCALHHRTTLDAGETLLVHSAAGGVGAAAVQLGKAAGARVIAVVGAAEKIPVARQLGADEVLGPDDDLVPAVRALTDGRGVDVVYDPVGGDVFDASRRVVAFEGRLLVIGFAGGRIADAPTNHALVKNYGVIGVHWSAYRQRAPELIAAWHHELLALWERGAVDPLVGGEYAFEELPAAFAALAARSTTGRVVLVSSRS